MIAPSVNPSQLPLSQELLPVVDEGSLPVVDEGSLPVVDEGSSAVAPSSASVGFVGNSF